MGLRSRLEEIFTAITIFFSIIVFLVIIFGFPILALLSLIAAIYFVICIGLTLVVLKVQSNSKQDQNAKQIVPTQMTERL